MESIRKTISSKLSLMRNARLIRTSKYFDEVWYIENNPDILNKGIDPALHYLLYGAKNGKNPSAIFSTQHYLSTHEDVLKSGMNPLVHFIKFGEKEGRSINSFINDVNFNFSNICSTPNIFSNPGFCLCCKSETNFVASSSWWRDDYLCEKCKSKPRERALMFCLEKFYPEWRNAIIHESSPIKRGASLRIKKETKNYIASQYFPGIKSGKYVNGILCENLAELSFNNESIDITITQDVFEHVLEPDKCFQEIARTLKPGGIHIFTVPLVNKDKKTEICATVNKDGSINYLQEPQYHGNPVSNKGSLVTTKWGYDITNYVFESSGLYTDIVFIDSLELGIRAEYIEVLITRKHH